MKKIMFANLKFLAVALALAVLACTSGVRPITSSDVLGGGTALDTTIRMKRECSVSIVGRTFILPIGEYRPTHVDSNGVFYAAPSGVTTHRGGAQQRIPGGIHMPNAGGRYYSFFSMWVALGEGDFSKLQLPNECWKPYGATVVLTRNGKEILQGSSN